MIRFFPDGCYVDSNAKDPIISITTKGVFLLVSGYQPSLVYHSSFFLYSYLNQIALGIQHHCFVITITGSTGSAHHFEAI